MEIIYGLIIISLIIVIFLMILYLKNRSWENILIQKQSEFSESKQLKRGSTKYQYGITLVSLACFAFIFSGINLGLLGFGAKDEVNLESAKYFGSEMILDESAPDSNTGNLREAWNQVQTSDNYYLDNYDIGEPIEFDDNYSYKETISVKLNDQEISADIYEYQDSLLIYFPATAETYKLDMKK